MSLSPIGDDITKESDEVIGRAAATYELVSNKNQKAYYITNTVFDKLDMLKVGRKDGLFDWSVFSNKIRDGKTTYILPDNRVIRMRAYSTKLGFCLLYTTAQDGIDWLSWSTFYVDRAINTLSENWKATPQITSNEELIYKLLCFLYLSDNEEMVVPAGGKHGTRKSGKIINYLPFPIITVTSKWNVTSVRTEGFPVSGHLRLQPTNTGVKMIFIAPFEKHGYTRTAKSESQ